MTIQELVIQCADAINNATTSEIESMATISLKLPEGKAASRHRYPWGRSGPKGTVVSWGHGGYDVVLFNAYDVLAYLIAMGVAAMKEMPDGSISIAA